MYWLKTAPDGQLRYICSAPSQDGFGWLVGMKRSTLAAVFVTRPLVVKAAPSIGMYPWPRTPSAPQPCVIGEVTSERAAWLELQVWTSSNPNSRARPDADAQAAVAALAGVPRVSTPT